MNADPHIDIAAIARIGELCERLFKEGTLSVVRDFETGGILI